MRMKGPLGRITLTALLAASLVGGAGAVVSPPHGYVRRVSSSGPFVLHYPKNLTRMAAEIERHLVGGAESIASDFGLEAIDTVDVYIAGSDDEYRAMHHGMLPEWGAAFSALATGELGLNAGALLAEPRPLRTVILHELSHLLFAQRTRTAPCPTWFLEGLAMTQSSEWTAGDRWMLAKTVWRGNLPHLDELEGRFPRSGEEARRAYLISYAAVEELLAGRAIDLVTFTAQLAELQDFDRAFLITFGEHPEDFSPRFRGILDKRYRTTGAIISASPYWGGVTLLFILAYLFKRRHARRKLLQWEANGDS